jgi:cytochrome P450
LYANLDVTTSAMSWSTILLAQHPEQQTLLREDVLQQNCHSPEEYINRSGTFAATAVIEAARIRPILGMYFATLNDVW